MAAKRRSRSDNHSDFNSSQHYLGGKGSKKPKNNNSSRLFMLSLVRTKNTVIRQAQLKTMKIRTDRHVF